jgi:hypothetical protein
LFSSQLVFRPFSDNMKKIAKSIKDFIIRKYRSDKRVQIQPFNSATIITYVNEMAFAEHRDQDFKKDGSFDQIKNLQIQDTVMAVLCFGDPRQLDFTIHKATQRKIEKICKNKTFDLTHGSLFVLHPNNEKPMVRQFSNKNEPTFFKHSCKGEESGNMSLGIVFRSVSHFCQVDKKTGCAVSDVSDGARRRIADNMKEEDKNHFKCVWNACKNKHFNSGAHHHHSMPMMVAPSTGYGVCTPRDGVRAAARASWRRCGDAQGPGRPQVPRRC